MDEIKTCKNYINNRFLTEYGFKYTFIKDMGGIKMENKKEKTEYKKAQSGNILKFENEGDVLEGQLLKIEESIIYPKSYGISVKTDNGEIVTGFVNKIVTDLIATNGVKIGMQIKILYTGMVKTVDGKREYKNFEIFYK